MIEGLPIQSQPSDARVNRARKHPRTAQIQARYQRVKAKLKRQAVTKTIQASLLRCFSSTAGKRPVCLPLSVSLLSVLHKRPTLGFGKCQLSALLALVASASSGLLGCRRLACVRALCSLDDSFEHRVPNLAVRPY